MSKYNYDLNGEFNIDDMNRYLYDGKTQSKKSEDKDREDVELDILRSIEENDDNYEEEDIFENAKFIFKNNDFPVFELKDHIRTVLSIDMSMLIQNTEADNYLDNFSDSDIHEAVLMAINACYPIGIISKKEFNTDLTSETVGKISNNYLFSSSCSYFEESVENDDLEYIYHIDEYSNDYIDDAIEYAKDHKILGVFLFTLFSNLYSNEIRGVNFRDHSLKFIEDFKNSDNNNIDILEYIKGTYTDGDFDIHEIDINKSYMDLMNYLNIIINENDSFQNDVGESDSEDDDDLEDYSDILEGEDVESIITPEEAVENKFGIKSEDYESSTERIIRRATPNDNNESLVVTRR